MFPISVLQHSGEPSTRFRLGLSYAGMQGNNFFFYPHSLSQRPSQDCTAKTHYHMQFGHQKHYPLSFNFRSIDKMRWKLAKTKIWGVIWMECAFSPSLLLENSWKYIQGKWHNSTVHSAILPHGLLNFLCPFCPNLHQLHTISVKHTFTNAEPLAHYILDIWLSFKFCPQSPSLSELKR